MKSRAIGAFIGGALVFGLVGSATAEHGLSSLGRLAAVIKADQLTGAMSNAEVSGNRLQAKKIRVRLACGTGEMVASGKLVTAAGSRSKAVMGSRIAEVEFEHVPLATEGVLVGVCPLDVQAARTTSVSLRIEARCRNNRGGVRTVSTTVPAAIQLSCDQRLVWDLQVSTTKSYVSGVKVRAPHSCRSCDRRVSKPKLCNSNDRIGWLENGHCWSAVGSSQSYKVLPQQSRFAWRLFTHNRLPSRAVNLSSMANTVVHACRSRIAAGWARRENTKPVGTAFHRVTGIYVPATKSCRIAHPATKLTATVKDFDVLVRTY